MDAENPMAEVLALDDRALAALCRSYPAEVFDVFSGAPEAMVATFLDRLVMESWSALLTAVFAIDPQALALVPETHGIDPAAFSRLDDDDLGAINLLTVHGASVRDAWLFIVGSEPTPMAVN